MDFSLTEEQKMLKEQAQSFCKKECSRAVIRGILKSEKGYSPELWRKMASLGWQGLSLPEEYGGTGGTFTDLIVLLEELGKAALPSPLFSSVVLGGMFILEAGNKAQKKEFLPGIAIGESLFTLALTEPGGDYQADSIATVAAPGGDGYVINGVKLFVPDALIADHIICIARTSRRASPENGITAFVVSAKSAGISRTPLKTIARDKQCEVLFENVHVPAANVLGRINRGWHEVEKVLSKAYVAQCAEMVGGFDAVLEMTVNYAKQRVQWGHPLGAFQSIQHMCSQMAIDLDISRFLTYEAAWKIDQGLPSATEASMAKAWTSSAYWRAAVSGQQIHGGVGYVEDPDIELYVRKAKALEVTFGGSDSHREKIAQALGL